MRNAWLKMAKNQRNAKQNPEATLLSKNNRIYSKKQAKNNCVRIHEIMRVIIMKIKMKMKNRSYIYNMHRSTRSRHGHKFSKCKRLSVWWCLYVPSNTLATFEAQFMKNLSNTEDELKESAAYKKNVYLSFDLVLIWPAVMRNFLQNRCALKCSQKL